MDYRRRQQGIADNSFLRCALISVLCAEAGNSVVKRDRRESLWEATEQSY